MPLQVERIYTSTFFEDMQKTEPFDVVVFLNNGDQYIASFVPYSCLEELFQKHELSGEFAGGAYFWSRNMLLIKDNNLETLLIVVNNLLEEGEFQWVFEKV